MSYLVLARKWRPQVFEDVVGQRHITQTLQNAISQKRVAHAFLFTGARGVGKTSTARILAKALNCDAGPRTNPCNQCATCHEISSGTSMDVIEIDGASNRGIDEIRELRENVRYTPAKSRNKIYIIDEVHMLTREAFNALLKTLEEPPPHIVFIFATTEPHKIPATILSRCQRYDFKKIPLKEIAESLRRIIDKEKIQISQSGLLSLAQESEGSLRDAQSLLDQVISYGGNVVRDEDIAQVLGLIDRKILYDTIEAIADRDSERCMEMVDHIYHYGDDLQHYCRELLQYFRNLILVKVSQHPERLMELPEEEFGILKKQAEKFEFDQLEQLFHLLLKGEEEIAQSTFPRIMLEMTLLRMATLRPLLPIDEILKKLELLEGKAGENLQEIGGSGTRPGCADKPPLRLPPQIDPGQPSTEADEEKRKVSVREESSDGLARQGGPRFGKNTEADDSEEDSKRVYGEKGCQGGLEEIWKGLVDFARAKNPVLGAFLSFGSLVCINGEKIEIGFEKDSFHYERIVEKKSQSQLEGICQEYFQRKVKVAILSLDEKVVMKERMGFEAEGKTPKEMKKGGGKGMEENLVIQEALRLFDGKILES